MVFVSGLYTGRFHGEEDAPEKFKVCVGEGELESVCVCV